MAEKKIVELNQTADRLKRLFDQVDSVISVYDADGNLTANEGKYWTTGRDEEGKDIIKPVELSADEDYKALQGEVEQAQAEVSDIKDDVIKNTEDLQGLDARVRELEANMDMIASKITITRITPATISVLYTNPGIIEYNVISQDSTGAETGSLTVTWRRGGVNGVLLKTETVQQGDNSFKLDGYLTKGDNTITATFTDSYGTSRTTNWAVNAVDIELVSDFDDTQTYEGNVTISYAAKGSVDKVVHFELDGEEIYSLAIVAGDNTTHSYNLVHRPHGTYALKVYMTATVGTTKVTSNIEYYDIMFIDTDNTDTLIRWPYDVEVKLNQYQPTTFKYSVYTPNKSTSKINLIVDGVILSTLTVDATEQEWVYRPQEYGSKTFNIQCINEENEILAEKIKTIEIIKFPYDISQVVGNLELDFNPIGRTNNDINYNEFTYTSTSTPINGQPIVTTMSVNEGFDWNNGGWKTDEEGNSYFCIKAGDRMTLSYPLFKDNMDAKGYGKNIKMIYRATNCRNFKAPVMSCIEERGVTHKITINTLIVDSEDKEISSTESVKYYVNGVNPEDALDTIDINTPAGETIEETTEEITNNKIITTKTIEVDQSFVGLDVQAQDATLYSLTGKVEAVYCEDKIMALEFNIESQGELKNTMTAYTDADPIKVELYDAGTASFVHTTAKPIVFGSDECDVHLYRFKAYSTMLTDDDIMSNYIADALNSTEMVERYERNNILNQSGELDYEALSKLYPELRIILITCPRFTNDKDDKVEGCTVQQIMGNQKPKHNWTANNVRIKGQGTSSNEYGTSARNIDLKFNKYTKEGLYKTDSEGNPIQAKDEKGELLFNEDGTPVYELLEIAFEYSDGTNSSKYAMTEDSIGVNYINVKVNVASSENANNSRLAQRFHQYNPYKRPARISNPKVRDTMEFHPCVIFIKELGYYYDENGNKITVEPQEFPASESVFSFYACGDFGNSKKNHEAFGMNENNLNECIVEISNNTHPLCKFQRPEGWAEMFPVGFNTTTNQLTEYADYWDGDAIEFRYPEDLYAAAINKKNEWSEEEIADARARLAVLQPAVQRLWSWVESTDLTKATNAIIEQQSWDTEYKYTTDSEEYRKAKFVAEYKNYFEPNSLLFHYLFTDRYLMIDNRAKNVFIHTEDGEHWDFCFNYDDDTSLGCDNRGDLKFDYYYEDIDQINGINVYNAQDSVLWVNVRNLLWTELCDVYDSVTECWSANNLVKSFSDYQAYKPERLEMIDMRRKYLRPYKEGHYRTNLKQDSTGKTIVSQGQYLAMLNGRKALQRERFEKYRSVYCDSKYQSTALKEDLMTFRANSPDYADPSNPQISVTWGEYFDITPYCDMYLYLDFDTNVTEPIRSKAGIPTRIYKPEGKLEDKNTRIYGASMISDIGDLAPFFIEAPDFAKGTKLSTLKIGDESLDYKASSELTSLTLGSNTMLETLDLRGCQDLKIGLDLSKCSGLKSLYTERSGITGVTFADGGLVETVKLNAIGSLKAHNLKNLQEFSMTNYLMLTSLNVENTSLLTALDFIKSCSNLNTLRLIGVNWDFSESDINTFLDKFLDDDKYAGIDDKGLVTALPVISGSAHYNTIKESQFNNYKEVWPNLEVTYNNWLPQYLVQFKNWDGSILYETYMDLNAIPFDPVEKGLIPTPTREPSASTIYTYKGWSGDLTSPIISNRILTATYSETTRVYTVNWYKDSTLLQTKTVEYGSEVEYTGDQGIFQPQYNSIFQCYDLFKGWNNSTSFIKEDTNVVALWERGNYHEFIEQTNEGPKFINGFDTRNLNAAQIYSLSKLNNYESLFVDEEGKPIGDRIKIKMGHEFNYTNIKKEILIEEPMCFKGKEIKDTGIALLNKNEDWILFIDAQFTTKETTALMSCFNGNKGIRLLNDTNNNPIIKINNTETTATSPNANWGLNREVFIIRHKKEKDSLDIFVGFLNELNPRKFTITPSTGFTNNNTLIFGGEQTTAGIKYGTGIVYRSELWYGFLADKECKEFVSWPYEEYEFDIVGIKNYETNKEENEGLTRIDFFASQLTAARLSYFNNPNPKTEGKFESPNLSNLNNYSFFNSYIKYWLNTRFIDSMPYVWHNILETAKVPSINRNSDETLNIITEETKCWIPSMLEIFKEQTNTYGDNVLLKEEGSSSIGEVYSPNVFYNRFAISIPTVDWFNDNADWYYSTSEDPSLTNTVKNGSVWENNGSYYIYNEGFWFDWKNNYFVRSLHSKGPYYKAYNSSGTSSYMVSTYFDNTTKHGILPCFSL